MKTKIKREVVWKDTDKYPFSIPYNYPTEIRNRCLFFWTTTLKGWRATLNFADKLTSPNRICIVYLFGEAKEELVQKHVKKLDNSRLIIFWADHISNSQIEKINAGIEAVNIVCKWGNKDKQNLEIKEIFDFDYESHIHRQFNSHNEKADLIENGKKENEIIKSQIQQYGYRNLEDNSHIGGAEEEHFISILKIIKRIYPYGIEADTNEKYAYKVLQFEKWCNFGISGNLSKLDKLGVTYTDSSAEYVQISLFDNTSWGIKEFVTTFQNIADGLIQQNGFFDFDTVFRAMQEPPFGMYECNYYGLCIGIALRKYRSGYYKSGELYTRKTEEVMLHVDAKLVMRGITTKRSFRAYIYTQTDKQIRLAEKLLEIFPPEWGVGCICLENVLTVMRRWFADNVMYDTVQRSFPELFEIVNLFEPCVCSNVTERYAEWLTDEKAEQIKESINHIDDKFFEMLSEKYGERKAGLYKKSQGVKGGAIGWLHSVEMVDERVEKYMKSVVCRECGAVLHDYDEFYENGDYRNGRHARLTRKNIINLNKKFLGRYQTEYFCINCLCEELDISEWELYEKMLKFKEQGCQLF